MTAKSSNARLAPVLFGIQSRLGSTIDLASMARQVGASPFHFHRMFLESVGETPRRYVERLRLERALLRLALTDESIQDICHAVGFQNHETFSRSFKRHYRYKPIEVRQFAEWQRGKGIRMAAAEPRTRCELSAVRFESLRPGFLLAKRRVGEYSSFDYAPFTAADRLWSSLARWATRHGARYAKTAWGLTHDIPGLTPPQAQRFDGCIRIDRAVADSHEFRCSRFDGGDYAVIDHAGDASTVIAAFAELGDVINLDSDRCIWRDGPLVTVYKTVHGGSNSLRNKTTAYFPITRLRQSKKRQGFIRGTR